MSLKKVLFVGENLLEVINLARSKRLFLYSFCLYTARLYHTYIHTYIMKGILFSHIRKKNYHYTLYTYISHRGHTQKVYLRWGHIYHICISPSIMCAKNRCDIKPIIIYVDFTKYYVRQKV